MNHPIKPVIKKQAAANRDDAIPPQWPSYTGTSRLSELWL
jgi:hypothetical protein